MVESPLLQHQLFDFHRFRWPASVCQLSSSLSVKDQSVLLSVVYQPGSVHPPSAFIDELSSLLERLAVVDEIVVLVGDLSIRFDRTDVFADQIRLLADSLGFEVRQPSSSPTHRLGGTLDVVLARRDVLPDVTVFDIGLSDQFLLSWQVPIVRLSANHVMVSSRPWRRLDLADFRCAI